jgi:hypothetical protein
MTAWITCAAPLAGCLYTTQHFNNGRLLEPGRTSLTLGAGRSHTLDYGCPELEGSYVYKARDSAGIHCLKFPISFGGEPGSPDTVAPVQGWNGLFKGSLDYRLGVHGPFGPFTAAEIGIHLEAPTNPASAEFDLKAGLPVPAGRPYHHALSAGIGIGAWADNSYFCEYALSRAFAAGDLFVNYRGTYLATQIADLRGSEDRRRFNSRRRFIHQASLGFSWNLPSLSVMPDFLVPLVTLTYPIAPAGTERPPPDYVLDEHVWDFGLGMGWSFR